METSSNQINDAQTSNGIKEPMCLVDIPMPSANESQSDTTTSKDGIPLSNTNPIEPSPGEMAISSAEKSQNDMQRQLNLISAPPPPPPEHVHVHEPKSTLSANITIATQRTVNIFDFMLFARCFFIRIEYGFSYKMNTICSTKSSARATLIISCQLHKITSRKTHRIIYSPS